MISVLLAEGLTVWRAGSVVEIEGAAFEKVLVLEVSQVSEQLEVLYYRSAMPVQMEHACKYKHHYTYYK